VVRHDRAACRGSATGPLRADTSTAKAISMPARVDGTFGRDHRMARAIIASATSITPRAAACRLLRSRSIAHRRARSSGVAAEQRISRVAESDMGVGDRRFVAAAVARRPGSAPALRADEEHRRHRRRRYCRLRTRPMCGAVNSSADETSDLAVGLRWRVAFGKADFGAGAASRNAAAWMRPTGARRWPAPAGGPLNIARAGKCTTSAVGITPSCCGSAATVAERLPSRAV
jgi:hypothetical protein